MVLLLKRLGPNAASSGSRKTLEKIEEARIDFLCLFSFLFSFLPTYFAFFDPLPHRYGRDFQPDRWMVGWLVGWFIGWLVGWMVGWSVGWLFGRLVGWLVPLLLFWCF